MIANKLYEGNNKNELIKIISILDGDNIPSDLSESVIYKWNGYQENLDFYSVPAYIERNSDRLKGKYLTFINKLGEATIDEKKIIDHLSLKNGYNLWWLSLIAEKSPFKSSGIFDSLRLLALEEIMITNKPIKLILHSNSKILAESLKILCLNLNVKFDWNQIELKNKSKKINSLSDIYLMLPYQVRNFISYIKQLFKLLSLRRQNNAMWFSGEKALIIISYFNKIEKNALDKGSFCSGYWGSLNNSIHDIGKNVNWLQIISPNPVVPNISSAESAIKKFNKNRSDNGFHTFLDSYMNFSCIARSFYKYIKLFFKRWHWNNKSISAAFQPKGSSVCLWPVLKNDWITSVRGLTAFQNFLWIELFDKAMADIPKQKMGLYSMENQNWERALLHAWKRHGHGKIIGVVHNPVRYWDLRYFNNITVEISSNNTLTQPYLRPDFVAINGPFSKKLYLDDGYPSDELVAVEALAYEDLSELVSGKKLILSGKKNYKNVNTEYKVLILGQILRPQTHATLKCLVQAVENTNMNYNFTLKPHPNCPISLNDYPSLSLKQTNDSLGKILPNFDLVIVAGSSTSALDAYIAGAKVVVFLDSQDFNYSPVRGFNDVMFVKNLSEMKEILELKNISAKKEISLDSFFWLEKSLPKWRHILKI